MGHKIGDAELEVMKVVWDCGAHASSTEIVQRLKALRGWEDTTIYTMIGKLVKKGFLRREKRTVSFYSAILTEQAYMLEQTQGLLDKLFGGDAKQLVSMLVENRKVGAEDIEALRRHWGGESNG